MYETALGRAAADGVITTRQVEQLLPYLRSADAAPLPDVSATGPFADLSTPLSTEKDNGVEDSEMPRFVRGFHDVLITIGLLIGLAGVMGLGSIFAVIPVIIVLAEILVRRQRLALPAVVLTMLFAWAIFMLMMVILEPKYLDGAEVPVIANEPLLAFAYILPFPLLLGAFYWRYKVPLALAATIFSAGAAVLSAVLVILSTLTRQPDFLVQNPKVSAGLFFIAAVSVFVIALRFDLKDPLRTTRRSDVAFWLHLVAAPSLLYTTLAFVFLDHVDQTWWSETVSWVQAVAVLVIVSSFMKIGLLLDRRAFVTSGLISLGYAIYTLFQKSNLTTDSALFVILLIIGLLVLSLGIGWPHIRRFMFRFLPQVIKTNLPPLR